uniref:Uncharacterized protein n=1 Tax=Picea glauca TaxID=3330 RepID=A0A101LYK0_PICGL|nr:hypothetical protein ABT39_MTgene5844 [Picea glauca]QHR92327.1 hypothetical protein Q903MT_gene6369 [Picea sitchensis]
MQRLITPSAPNLYNRPSFLATQYTLTSRISNPIQSLNYTHLPLGVQTHLHPVEPLLLACLTSLSCRTGFPLFDKIEWPSLFD